MKTVEECLAGAVERLSEARLLVAQAVEVANDSKVKTSMEALEQGLRTISQATKMFAEAARIKELKDVT